MTAPAPKRTPSRLRSPKTICILFTRFQAANDKAWPKSLPASAFVLLDCSTRRGKCYFSDV